MKAKRAAPNHCRPSPRFRPRCQQKSLQVMSQPFKCSARGCRADAVWALRWNTPKLHTPERRKVWLACEGHREYLGALLGARDFLKDTIPVTELAGGDSWPPLFNDASSGPLLR